MNAVNEKAYAKINLFLDVTAKRDDGYHDIKSVMHAVTLADELTVSKSESSKLKIRLLFNGDNTDGLPHNNTNLAVKAAESFYSHLKSTADVTIRLVKKIPVAAGLGGGSSDAAAVLRALNKLHKRPFTDKYIAQIGAEIGSDVPFCVFGKTALCEGRGEKVTPLYASKCLNIVIANSGERVSTPEAYSALDAKYKDFREKDESFTSAAYAGILSGLKGEAPMSACLFNIFEESVLGNCPLASLIKQRLLVLGAECAMMSGSGPSIFALFNSFSMAESAVRVLKADGVRAFAVRSAE